MIKFTNQERTSAIFNESTFISLSAPEDWDSIGDGPTREAVKAWLAAGNVPQPVDEPNPNEAILAQIAAIEAKTMVPRVVREALLLMAQDLAEREATQLTAAGKPTTKEELLAENVGYLRTLSVDNQIKQLRGQLK